MTTSVDTSTDIAIVGMAVRTPGANSPDELWEIIVNGRDALTRLNDADLVEERDDLRDDPRYVRVAGRPDHYDCFDAGFFGISARDGALMDPQHRVFLETAWAAFEDGGLVPDAIEGSVGVFASSGMNTYLLQNLMTNPELVEQLGMFLIRHTGNDKDFLATELSYLLNLTGPSVNVQTACSSSLVATHLAVQSLLSAECDVALAGGCTIELPFHGYLPVDGDVLSTDGICRAFDVRSNGTIFSSGAAAVILKRFADAVRDGDLIQAVIKGTAINNDGSSKVGYLAPSVEGHAAVVAEALAVSGIDASTIGLLEAHGTGTHLGDPIEVAALTEAFRSHTNRRGFCSLSSTKPNVGHLDTAAGLVSLIKAAMAIERAVLPPLANHQAPHPDIHLESTPFVIDSTAREWTQPVRRAGVSSLGVGGTNAHVILQSAPPLDREPASNSAAVTLCLSAKSEGAVRAAAETLAEFLDHHGSVPLGDVAATLLNRRSQFAYRIAVGGDSAAELARNLRQTAPVRLWAVLVPASRSASVTS